MNNGSLTPATEEEIASVLAENGVSSPDEVLEGALAFNGWREWFDYLIAGLREAALKPEVREAFQNLPITDHGQPD